MTKMTDAFKKVFLGLGGNPKELAENNDVGDYIVDLEGAIKEYVNEAATHELPTPEAEDIGKVVSVVTDGDEGAEYSLETPTVETPKVFSAMSSGKISNITFDDFYNYCRDSNYKNHVCWLVFREQSFGDVVEKASYKIPCVSTYENTQESVTTRSIIFYGVIRKIDGSFYYRKVIYTDTVLTATITDTALT